MMSISKTKAKLLPFDAARYLTDDEAIAEYMTAVLDTEDTDLRMRSINRVPCAIGAGVIGTEKARWRTAAQRPGSLRRQGSSAS